MKFKVRVFIGEQQIDPSKLSKLTISNPTIDRIVNDIVDRVSPESKRNSQSAIERRYPLLE